MTAADWAKNSSDWHWSYVFDLDAINNQGNNFKTWYQTCFLCSGIENYLTNVGQILQLRTLPARAAP